MGRQSHVVFGNSGSGDTSGLSKEIEDLKDTVSGLVNDTQTTDALEASILQLQTTLNSVQSTQKYFTPNVVYGNMSNTGSTLSVSISVINFKATLTKTSTSNISMAVSSISGTTVVDIKKLAFYDNGIDNAAFDTLTLTTTANTIDSTIYLATRDNPQMEIWNQNVCWKVNILISGSSAERVRIYSYPITGPDIIVT